MKVLTFIDNCGHCAVFDLSTPEQEHKIFEGICKEAARTRQVSSKDKQTMKELLKTKQYDELTEFFSELGIIDIGQRGGPDIVEVETEWQEGLL